MGSPVPQPAAMLLDFIGSKEAQKGYDTVYANRMDRMPKPLTRMTMKEILDQGRWRTKTFGPSAFSRYQFMDATLQDLATKDTRCSNELLPSRGWLRLGVRASL